MADVSGLRRSVPGLRLLRRRPLYDESRDGLGSRDFDASPAIVQVASHPRHRQQVFAVMTLASVPTPLRPQNGHSVGRLTSFSDRLSRIGSANLPGHCRGPLPEPPG